MSLSKKHFEEIAKIISNNSFGNDCLHLDNKRNVVNDFCKYFKTQNKNFNSFKFYNACFINQDYNNVAKDINFDEVFLGRVSNQKEGK
tara:strand:+ start:221 stop:484 length:264 start_codon:yes stop_codon:yes gene_type:complete